MQSTNGAMDSSLNSAPNPESCRNSSPRPRLWNIDPPNRVILALARIAGRDSHKAYFDSAFAENVREKCQCDISSQQPFQHSLLSSYQLSAFLRLYQHRRYRAIVRALTNTLASGSESTGTAQAL